MSEINAPSPRSQFNAWSQLVRLPTVFTLLANVAAAFFVVAHSPFPLDRFVCVLLANVALYWGGMILNDVFDIQRDKNERPERPIPAGQVTLQRAGRVGFGLLGLGIALAAASGLIPSSTYGATWIPAVISVTLALSIYAYDGPLKATIAAPLTMGACRSLSFLLGTAPCLVSAGTIPSDPVVPIHLVAISLGFGTYIMGLTTMGRKEASGGTRSQLAFGLLFTVIGAILLAFSPQLLTSDAADRLPSQHVSPQVFPFLVAMIVLPVLIRGFRATVNPTPISVQMLMRVGILTMIPLSAAYALWGAGPIAGMLVFAMVVPALYLSARMRVT